MWFGLRQAMFIYNDPTKKKLRQLLRYQSPKAEQLLWGHLKGRQFLDLKFRRQYGVDRFVIDFYCSELRLGVEVDGNSHCTDQAKTYDNERSRHIAAHDITVIRFTNEEIFHNIEQVLLRLADAVNEIRG